MNKRQASKTIHSGAACVVSQASPVENLRHAVDAACNDGVYFDEALRARKWDGVAEPGMSKLSLANRAMLVRYALERDWLD